MTVQYNQGSYTVTAAPNITFRLSGENLVALLAYFNFKPHYKSPEQLGTIAQLVFTNPPRWFSEWDDLEAFAHYTAEDWDYFRSTCDPPTLHISIN